YGGTADISSGVRVWRMIIQKNLLILLLKLTILRFWMHCCSLNLVKVRCLFKAKISTYQCFFFSSRRRHTRSKRDWSSDVCSSDLHPAHPADLPHDPGTGRAAGPLSAILPHRLYHEDSRYSDFCHRVWPHSRDLSRREDRKSVV